LIVLFSWNSEIWSQKSKQYHIYLLVIILTECISCSDRNKSPMFWILFFQEHPGENGLKNIANLLYNGFYCFEAITHRSLDDVICGICGTVGELYLGDGNEKNCCSIGEVVIFKGYRCNYGNCVYAPFLCVSPFISLSYMSQTVSICSRRNQTFTLQNPR